MSRMDRLKILPALPSPKIVINMYAVDNGQLAKGFESVPRKWPLAKLTVPWLKCVDHLDRVLAGCCWEVLITRQDPDDSLGALRQAAREPDPHVGELFV